MLSSRRSLLVLSLLFIALHHLAKEPPKALTTVRPVAE